MIKLVKEYVYMKKEIGIKAQSYKIEINDNENTLIYTDYLNNLHTLKVSDENVSLFFDSFFRIIDDWKEEYIDNTIIDGLEWKIKIKYKNGYVKKYYGKNKTPINFSMIDKIQKEFIERCKE